MKNKMILVVVLVVFAILFSGSTAQAKRFTSQERYLLKKIAMAEAEGESLKSKAMVILVVLNRVKSDDFPNTIGEVIFQEGQFSPLSDGRWFKVEPNRECEKAMRVVEHGWDKSDGATFFEVTSNYSTWHSRNLQLVTQIGRMAFYK